MGVDFGSGETSVAARIAHFLQARGVSRVFGLQGGHIQPIWDWLGRLDMPIVDVRDEGAAVHMAHAYGELTGELGVAMATAGPGVTNCVTAIANASLARQPLLLIGGCPPRPQVNKGPLQDIPHVDIMAPVTRRARTLRVADQVIREFDEAVARARGVMGEPGPVYLEIPTDVLRQDVPDALVLDEWMTEQPHTPLPPPPDLVDAAVDAIWSAERPVVVTGRGARGADEALVRFLDASGALYLDTQESRGLVPSDHPSFAGAVRGNVMADADLLFVIGRKLDYQLGYGSPAVFPHARILRLSNNAGELIDNRRGDPEILADPSVALDAMVEHAGNRRPALDQDWAGGLRAKQKQRTAGGRAVPARGEDGKIHPQKIFEAIAVVADPDYIAVADGGDLLSFARIGLGAGTYLDAGAFGCLGVGVPFGVAASLAFPDRQVISVNGDGAYGINAMEIDTAVRHGAKAVFIVSNNAAWNIERYDQEENYGGRVVGTTLRHSDYAAMARALGAHGERVDDPGDLEAALKRALDNAPAVIDVVTTQHAVSSDATKGLGYVPDYQPLTAWDDAEKGATRGELKPMDDRPEQTLGPWNPGLSSTLPAAARPLSTIYRPENIVGSMEGALERRAFTGLEPEDLVAFRPERLVVHELLIRVTGEFSIPDGKRYADLGINFREVVDTILKRDLEPAMPKIIEGFNALKEQLRDEMAEELSRLDPPTVSPAPPPAKAGGLLGWLGLRNPESVHRPPDRDDHAAGVLDGWRSESVTSTDPRRRRLCRALAQITGAIAVKHGCVPIDTSVIAEIALDLVMNDHGSAVIGEMIDPLIAKAVEREGYPLLPCQAEPVVMNVKGASAAGKSTLRPLQRKLAKRLGIDWADFALISPDIWRKYLLDYDSLGEFWRYAGTLTGHELRIVDQKLDRYMAEKARQGRIPHLLIDRFRFDSFAESDGGEQGSRLLTRFGSTIYMFFVITPPEATVERAWKRGLEFGRFKAVDDLLHHNVEAFTGMPDLFFTWATRKDKRVHYEFLDNGVPLGEPPRTIAFGWDGDMTLLDIKRFLDVDRFKRIDIDATSPEAVYPDADDMAPENNTGFLKRCAKEITQITLADQKDGRVIARIEGGKLVWIDRAAFDQAMTDPDSRVGLAVLTPEGSRDQAVEGTGPVFLKKNEAPTLGAYGGRQA